MIETRNKLRDLLSKADRSDELDSLLERVLKNQEDLNKLAGDLGDGGDKGGAA
jgi:type VI secretion system protein ImpB